MKAIALAVCVLMISLTFGVGQAVNPGDSCTAAQFGKAQCSASPDLLMYLLECRSPTPNNYKWDAVATGLSSEDCVSQCNSEYGPNCLGSQTPPSGSNLILQFMGEPLSIERGGSARLIWGVESGTTVTISNLPGPFTINGNRIVAPTQTTTYILRATKGQQSEEQSVMITVSGTGPGSSRDCCVKKPTADTYRYESGVSQVTCEAQGNFFVADSCNNVANRQCRTFCLEREPSRDGTCQAALVSANTPNQFIDICNTGQVCQCGQINTREQQARESCQNFCLTGTQFAGVASTLYTQQALSIPFGQCSSNPQLLLSTFNIVGAVGGTAAGAQSNAQITRTGNLGENQCASDERCYCITSRINSIGANNPNNPSTLPGTRSTPRWNPPDAIENPPSKATNERNCVAAVNASITASFGVAQMGQTGGGQAQIGLRLVQAGDPITITGKVIKLADQCDGYQYDCRQQQEVNCNLDSGFLKTKLEYKDCPAVAGERIHEEGEKEITNWRRIGAMVGTAAGIAGMVLTGGSTAVLLAGPTASMAGQIATSGCDASQVDALVATALQLTVRQAAQSSQNNNNPNQPGGGSPACAAGCRNGGFSGGSCVTTPGAPSDPYCGANQYCVCDSTGGSGISSQECSTRGGECTSSCGEIFRIDTCSNGQVCCDIGATAGGVTADPTFKVNGESVITGNSVAPPGAGSGASAGGFNPATLAALAPVLVQMFPNCPSPEDIVACFSVCGKEYQSRTTYAPTCERGGPVIGYDEKQYFCGLGECGGFAGKRVSIKVYGPDGGLAIDDSATAGANGEFSYTFNSPAGDGDFTVIAVVPRE